MCPIVPYAHQRTSVVSADGVDFGPSCAGHVLIMRMNSWGVELFDFCIFYLFVYFLCTTIYLIQILESRGQKQLNTAKLFQCTLLSQTPGGSRVYELCAALTKMKGDETTVEMTNAGFDDLNIRNSFHHYYFHQKNISS